MVARYNQDLLAGFFITALLEAAGFFCLDFAFAMELCSLADAFNLGLMSKYGHLRFHYREILFEGSLPHHSQQKVFFAIDQGTSAQPGGLAHLNQRLVVQCLAPHHLEIVRQGIVSFGDNPAAGLHDKCQSGSCPK